MDRRRVIRARLTTQRLASAPLATAGDAVRLLTCVQSQERDHAFFSLGMRARHETYAAVRAEYDSGGFLRTHILRPTWHFVAPEDVRWILALTSARVIAGMAARHRQLELDDPGTLGTALDALAGLLRGRTFLTRAEIGERFSARRGLPQPGEQLGHLLLIAELRGLICSGPMKGVHHSYGLLDELVTRGPVLDDDEAHVRLARRFFAGPVPASITDFTRWSSLTITGTRRALAEIGDDLERVEVDGIDLWLDPAEKARRSRRAPAAYLLPTYDEAVLSYPALNFAPVPGRPSATRPDAFWALIVAGEASVGLWRRTVRGTAVRIETRLAPSVDDATREGGGAAAGGVPRPEPRPHRNGGRARALRFAARPQRYGCLDGASADRAGDRRPHGVAVEP